MTKVVDEQVQTFQQRRLPSQYAAIFLDANYLPLKRDTVQKEAVHCIQPTWLRTLTSISNATPTTKNNFQRKIHWIDSWFLSLTSTTRSPWSESIADSTDFRTPWNHPLFKLTTYYMYGGISFTQDSWRYPYLLNRLISNGENQRKKDIYQAISCPINLLLHKVIYEHWFKLSCRYHNLSIH